MDIPITKWVSKTATNEHQESVLRGVDAWASFYRANIHRFAEDYLHIKLKDFQAIALNMMAENNTFVFIGSRGIGKSYLCAVFCVCMAILYPGTRICVASSVRSQAVNVLSKIMDELKPASPELAAEINERGTSLNSSIAAISFYNTSKIKVVTAGDSARGNRCNILIVDEFRMLKKDVIDTILRKFMSGGMRHPKYLDDPKYAGETELPKMLYLSSAYYQEHWSYMRCKDSVRFMLDDGKKNFCCGLPYELAIKENLLQRETVLEEMAESDFNEIKWSINISVLVKLIEPVTRGVYLQRFSSYRKW